MKQFTGNIKLYKTAKPDIVFEHNGKKIAIEVETGKVLKNYKKQFLEKVKQLNKIYGENWFFVLTDKGPVSKYKKFGKTLTKRNVVRELERFIQND